MIKNYLFTICILPLIIHALDTEQHNEHLQTALAEGSLFIPEEEITKIILEGFFSACKNKIFTDNASDHHQNIVINISTKTERGEEHYFYQRTKSGIRLDSVHTRCKDRSADYEVTSYKGHDTHTRCVGVEFTNEQFEQKTIIHCTTQINPEDSQRLLQELFLSR